ncbi:MAG: 4Fe-4S binding protein [Methanocellales archaeon]|nr:4Fe-4S binding protein [Methanocellales archaeon]MDI6859410.1 4Fe-4S binding protein [Methanocellales archaeon]MDI6902244.1 4Fe-4S binding protein [Methanocellales archaeon]
MKLSIGAVTEPGSTRINKTGSWRTFKPIIDVEACVGCGMCSMFCPEGVVYEVEDKYTIDYDYCKGCGVCAHECPSGAIEMVIEEK